MDRWMPYFEIRRHDHNVTVEEVKQAVALECDGPGKLLGYRAMHLKIRHVHDLKVARDKRENPDLERKKRKVDFILPDRIGCFRLMVMTN